MNKKYATLKDVAKLAGTTAATVSYVLNDSKDRYITDQMRRRVLSAAAKLNYVKSSVASGLKGKPRKIIAVLVPQFYNQFFTRMIMEIERVADEFDYILSICDTLDDPKREQIILERMAQHRVDGYIISASPGGAANTARLRSMGVPIVALDRPLEGEKADYIWVTTSNYACGYKATAYLTSKGHQRIGFLGWEVGIKDLLQREQGFWDALKDKKLSKQNGVLLRGAFTESAGYAMTKELLENHRDITAIFYAYNIQALGGIQYLTESGLEPGRDISIILIGSPEWAVSGRNNFTHIVQHEREMAHQAARILFNIINGQDDGHARTVSQECSLFEGNSVKDITQLSPT